MKKAAIKVGAPMIGLMAKHHRQEAFVMNTPPSGGPRAVALAVKIPIAPLTAGLSRRGNAYAIMLIDSQYSDHPRKSKLFPTYHKVPAQMPASPAPAIARPRIKIKTLELCAVALIIEPISKMTIDQRKHAMGEKMV